MVIELVEKRYLNSNVTLKVVKTYHDNYQGMHEAFTDLGKMDEPLPHNRTWQLVGEEYDINDIKVYESSIEYEYENTHNGDLLVYEYYLRKV